MRFPRNTKIFRGPLDAAPFASVLFVLMILLLVQSSLVYTPGVPIRLPETVDLPGTANPKVVVSIDGTGQMYFEHQISEASALKEKLLNAASRSKEPLTLIVQADRATRYELLLNLALIAREVGIRDVLLATRPRVIPMPVSAETAQK